MTFRTPPKTAEFDPLFFPQHLALVSVGENVLPMGYWTVVSKDPFRFLLCMGVGNHSLLLLKKYKEAALHLMPWEMREVVVRAGHLSGRDGPKAPRLGLELISAEKLKHTRLVAGAEVTFELTTYMEIMNISREFSPFVMDVVAVHGSLRPAERQPTLYLSLDDFATTGERWSFKK